MSDGISGRVYSNHAPMRIPIVPKDLRYGPFARLTWLLLSTYSLTV